MAEKVIQLAQEENHFLMLHDEDSIETVIDQDRHKSLWRQRHQLTPAAKRELKELEALGFSNYPIWVWPKPNTLLRRLEAAHENELRLAVPSCHGSGDNC